MTPFAGFVAGVSLMLLTDAAACFLLPQSLREAYRQRAAQNDGQMRIRGFWLAAGGAAGALIAVAVL